MSARVLAISRCPADGGELGRVFWDDDRLMLRDAGYRMSPAESHREEVALQVGVIWDAEDRAPTEEEYDEILDEAGGRFVQEHRTRPLLPIQVIASCKRCRTSYELDTARLLEEAARGRGANVAPLRRLTLEDAVAERMRRHAESTPFHGVGEGDGLA